VIMETNVPTALPPASGTLVAIGPGEIVSIAGLSVRREDLETLLGGPLDLYVNRVDGRTAFYGATLDRRSQGGTREEVALAGGSVNADTIAVEQITSTQLANAATPAFVRARYTLVRAATSLVLGAVPAPDPARPLPTLLQALRPLHGGER
jgi:hypothetical protein